MVYRDSHVGSEPVRSQAKIAIDRAYVRGIGAIAVLLATGLVLAGCASSSTNSLNAAAAKSAASAISAAVASGASGVSDGSSGSGAASTPSPSSTAKITGNSNSSFCVEAVAEQAQEDKNASALLGDNPADLQKFEEQAMTELNSFASKAPAQIKGAVQTLVAADQTFFAALKAANFDYTKLDPTAASAFDSPAVEAAADQVTDYLEQVCGINPTADSS